jgi:glutamyl/glutaminyl-tRNA synthetase
MHNFENYKYRLFKFFGWEPPHYSDLQQRFIKDMNKIAKRHGYKQKIFAENDQEERLFVFRRIEDGKK